MRSAAELVERRARLMARGEAERARIRKTVAVLQAAGSRVDRVLGTVQGFLSVPVVVAGAISLVLVLGRSRSLRLLAGGLGLLATAQRVRRLGASLGLLAGRRE
jgi:hypothetical protein